MNVEILTPDKKLFSGDAEYVNVPGKAGWFGILRNHAPLISTLKKGKVTVRESPNPISGAKGIEHYFEINGGIVEVKYDKVVLLAE